MNKVILMGRLTRDPELSQTPSGVTVARFAIAVNRRFAKEGQQQAENSCKRGLATHSATPTDGAV